jgi:hypothetical protein
MVVPAKARVMMAKASVAPAEPADLQRGGTGAAYVRGITGGYSVREMADHRGHGDRNVDEEHRPCFSGSLSITI